VKCKGLFGATPASATPGVIREGAATHWGQRGVKDAAFSKLCAMVDEPDVPKLSHLQEAGSFFWQQDRHDLKIVSGVNALLHASQQKLEIGCLGRVPIGEALEHLDDKGVERSRLTFALFASLAAKDIHG